MRPTVRFILGTVALSVIAALLAVVWGIALGLNGLNGLWFGLVIGSAVAALGWLVFGRTAL
jgi:hypothetical protein